MKKKVNGRVVDINNISLFEEAFEGAVLNKKASSAINDTIDNQSDFVKGCIELYYTYNKALPFPLNSIELPVKYAAIGEYLLDSLDEEDTPRIFVRDCLYVELDNGKALKLMNKTWAIESIKRTFEEGEKVDLDSFNEMTGYDEYKWTLELMKRRESLDGFYKKFMPEFVAACMNEPMIIKFELENILCFGYIPKQLNLEDNRIIDLSNNYEYFLDIFSTGKKETNSSVLDIEIRNGKTQVNRHNKTVKVYNFEVYGKAKGNGVLNRAAENKIEKKSVNGMGSVFEQIVTDGIVKDCVETKVYRGIIVDDTILFEVDNTIYACMVKSYIKSLVIAKNVKLFAYEKDRIYMKKETRTNSGIIRECIYNYDSTQKKLRICRINFRK